MDPQRSMQTTPEQRNQLKDLETVKGFKDVERREPKTNKTKAEP